jgi:hypothetical protein
MADGRPRYALMDCTACTNLPSRMLEKGLWWTDKNGEPMLTHPDFKVCVQDWLRFKPYWVDIDWANQVAMVKDGQVLSQLCPDCSMVSHKQGTSQRYSLAGRFAYARHAHPDFVANGPHVGTWGGTGCSVPKMTKENVSFPFK